MWMAFREPFVAIPSYEKNVKLSNGHQTDEDAAKAATMSTKKKVIGLKCAPTG
jgi:hypothetical protein